MKEEKQYSSPYSLDGRLPLRTAVPLGLQHVLAMFVGNLSPLLVIMGICGITAGENKADHCTRDSPRPYTKYLPQGHSCLIFISNPAPLMAARLQR